METLDEKLFLDKYNKGIEKDRLHKGLGLIEFARTKEILLEKLPPAPAVIYDIGGAYGEYSYWLVSLGYEVRLYDLSEKNIEMAKKYGKKCGVALCCAEVADARAIPQPDESADAILLFGPLYHLTERTERDKCLAECKRLLKPGGLLFTANITAYASTLHFVSVYDKKRKPALDSDDVFSGLERTVKTGVHVGGGLGLGYFHKPEELKAEIEDAGFLDVDIRGVIGPCWLIRNLDRAWKNEKKRENIMRVVRLLEKEDSLMGLSTHFLSISKKGNLQGKEDMEIRFAEEKDLEQINKLRKQVNNLHVNGKPEVFKPGFSDELQKYIYEVFRDPQKKIVVCGSHGNICAFAVLHHITKPENPYMFEQDYLDIDEFCVDEAFRRQGIGRRLIDFIRDFAKSEGFDRIELNMWEFNRDALAFYESVGFSTYRRYMEIKL